MFKPLLLLAVLGVAPPATETCIVRLTGDSQTISGIIVDGKEYAPVQAVAEKLGAKAVPDVQNGQRQIMLIPGAKPVKSFDDSPDTSISTTPGTLPWQIIAGSHGAVRARDFIRGKDSWDLLGEIEVAPESLYVAGHVPRDDLHLSLYCTGLDKDGKTVLRSIVGIDNVSFEGGRYMFKLNGYYGGQSLPTTILLRFNAASEMNGRGGDGGQGGGG
jgi:hypothetical protein